MDVAFPTCRRGTRASEQCARPARPVRASGGGRLDRVPRAREHGAHVRQAPPARRADGTAPQPCRAPRAPCVVVLINQVTTRANEVLGTSGLVPALGEAWAHICNVQVSLEWCEGVRLAALSKVAGPGRRSLLSSPMASDLPIRAQSCCGRPGRLRRRWLRRGCSAGRMPLLTLRRRAATAFSSRWRTARSRCTSKRAPAAAPSRTCSHSSSHDRTVLDCISRYGTELHCFDYRERYSSERFRRYSVCGITFRAKMQ